MNAGVVDQEVQRQAVERPPGRPAPVHGHTGTPARRVCTLSLRRTKPMQTVSSGVMWSCRLDWKTSRAAAFMTAWRRSSWNDGIPASVAFPESSFVSTNAATRDWKTEWDSERRMLRTVSDYWRSV